MIKDADIQVTLQDQHQTGVRKGMQTCLRWCAERLQTANQNYLQFKTFACRLKARRASALKH
eukprot:5092836-Pleurochrysis_carterae.AAC.1